MEEDRLTSRVNGKSYGIGCFELVSLGTLRERAKYGPRLPGRLRLGAMQADVRALHRRPEFSGALFQVASQFNMLEMVGPHICPEDGVTRYEGDPTQGPACAIAAGAATIYRNYFAAVGSQVGQTSARQMDGLADLGDALSQRTGVPVSDLWQMRNGYALCTPDGLAKMTECLTGLDEPNLDQLRGKLRIGIHRDVEVTDFGGEARPSVSQAFCSALPVAYSGHRRAPWKAFATLVLEAAYEATLWEAVCNAQRGMSNIALLTRVGGGAFGNDGAWIDTAMERALRLAAGYDLDVRVVTQSGPSPGVLRMIEALQMPPG
ncbi:MAG: hypothetical protein KF778_00480 [Rhodocyclaceae bacterium]|nr:hypothetical protein [Rhodocyclaceae bacterium]MBX3666856.1 hypothetical protein [Rhodocyclaceae bacterium]